MTPNGTESPGSWGRASRRHLGKLRLALFKIGHDRFHLVGRPDQCDLLAGLRKQDPVLVAVDGQVQKPLAGADGVRALPGERPRDIMSNVLYDSYIR